MSKYKPLENHFKALEKERWSTTFTEIEKILGSKLPASAHQYREWWANDATHTQAKSWLNAQYKSETVSFSRQTVSFRRLTT